MVLIACALAVGAAADAQAAADIYGYDLSTGEEFPISTGDSEQFWPNVSGNFAVWQDDRNRIMDPGGSDLHEQNYDIYGYRFDTQEEFPICTAAGYQGDPAIDGDIVVWTDYRNSSNADIYGYNLQTGDEFTVCDAAGSQYRPDVSGDLVVWGDSRNSTSDIYGRDLSTGEEFAVCTSPGDQLWPAIDGDIVAWVDDRSGEIGFEIYACNLSSGEEFPVSTESTMSFEPDVS
ncbi:MAG: hypothetical protein ABIF82_00090, partial [Planctomycetota bacterium]